MTELDSNKCQESYFYSTKFTFSTYHFEWTIQNYNSTVRKMYFMNSPTFPQWEEENKKWFLQIVREEKFANTLSIRVIKQEDYNGYLQMSLSVHSDCGEYNFGKLEGIKVKRILSKSIKFEVLDTAMKWNKCSSDHMTIICNIRIPNSLESIQQEIPTFIELEYEDSLGDKFSAFDDESFKDFTFIVGDKKFKVHRIILAAQSSVFAALFKSQMIEGLLLSADITDVEPDIFEKMLQFIYTNKIDKEDLKNSIDELLAVADKYDLKKLKRICAIELYENLSVDNVVETLSLADLYSIQKLKKKALEVVKCNLETLKNLESFKIFTNQRPHLLLDLLTMNNSTTKDVNDKKIVHTEIDYRFFEN